MDAGLWTCKRKPLNYVRRRGTRRSGRKWKSSNWFDLELRRLELNVTANDEFLPSVLSWELKQQGSQGGFLFMNTWSKTCSENRRLAGKRVWREQLNGRGGLQGILKGHWNPTECSRKKLQNPRGKPGFDCVTCRMEVYNCWWTENWWSSQNKRALSGIFFSLSNSWNWSFQRQNTLTVFFFLLIKLSWVIYQKQENIVKWAAPGDPGIETELFRCITLD